MPQKPLPWLIAHRGAMAEAPENVSAAFDLAFEHGVDGIELDVQLTKDGVPVVFHDDTLRRITGRPGSIADYPLRDLETFDYGSWFSKAFHKQKIPTLAAVIERYGAEGILMIEIKTPRIRKNKTERLQHLCRALIADIRNPVLSASRSGLFVLSFDAEILATCAQMAPELDYVRNVTRPEPLCAKDALPDGNLWGYCLPMGKLRPRFVSSVHDAGRHVLVYSCNSIESLQKAVDMGVDVVMTDDPGAVAPHFRGMRAQKGI